jgi:hypothetical protein
MLAGPGAGSIISLRIGSVQVGYGGDGAETVGAHPHRADRAGPAPLVGVAPSR